MALETVPKDLRHLRACLLCSLVKVKPDVLLSRAQVSIWFIMWLAAVSQQFSKLAFDYALNTTLKMTWYL